MNVSIIRKLDSKTKEELLSILEGVLSVKGMSEFINLNFLASSADKLKIIKKSFTKFVKRTKFHDYYKAIQFFEDLTREVLLPLENLIEESPKEVANFLQEVVVSFSKLVESKDDSSGCAVEFFSKTLELWGASWKHITNKDINQLAQMVSNIYLNDSYVDNEIIYYFRPALGKEGLIVLETYLTNDKAGLLYTIELQNDPDKYIKFIKDNQIENVENYFKIASMLISDFRADEAINWLKKVPDNTENQELYTTKQDLLIKALQEDGKTEEVQNIRWEAFNNTLYSKYYLDYIKQAPLNEVEQIRKSAINLAYQNPNFNAALYFLESIEEYTLIDKMIINNTKKLDQHNYSYYRKLSKNLAANGQYLSATLIRRSLVNDLLDKGVSNYYDYAVSDLKLSVDFGNNVEDWQSNLTNEKYINKLKSEHKKKNSFWDRINFVK